MKKIKVVKIVDSSNVVINVGKRDGVTLNSRFEIYGESEKVTDPETGEDLGLLGNVKAKIRPKHIHDKMTECSNSASMYDSAIMSLADIAFFSPLELNVDPDDISGRINSLDTTIRVGDKVEWVSDYTPPAKVEPKDDSNSCKGPQG